MLKHYRDCFDSISQQLPGILALRQTALEAFIQAGLPTLRNEQWKYTRLTPLEKNFFQPVESREFAQRDNQLIIKTLPDYLKNAYRLVFIDGHYLPIASHLPSPVQAFFHTIKSTLQGAYNSIEELLASDENANPFYALNTAFMSDGAYFTIPENTVVTEPLHLVFINSSPDSASYLRNIIHLGKNVEATINEHYFSMEPHKNFTNKVTQIILEQNAVLKHCLINQEGANAVHIGITKVKQEKGSQFQSHAVAFRNGLARNDIHVKMLAETACCHLKGLYVATNRAHVDFHTHIEHAVPNCQSYEHYKGIISDRARAVFNGKILVQADAQKTDAQLHNENLLLSRSAEIDTKPELEIYADDVKCSHGATVGQLDENSLFYLQSRGIDGETAKKMLITAFAQDAIIGITPISLQNALKDIILAG